MTDEIPCSQCQTPFKPTRPHQVFCSKQCRSDHHNAFDGGLRGVVSSVRVMRRGSVSVVLRFGIEDRERALKLEPGKLLDVVTQ